jgi:hypothetical protein
MKLHREARIKKNFPMTLPDEAKIVYLKEQDGFVLVYYLVPDDLPER